MSSNNTFNTGPATHTAGPHKSDMANRLDPRVDSDLDGSATLGGNRTGNTGYNVPKGTYGPHGSRMANAADPRVDSDHDRTIGPNSHTSQVDATGYTGGQDTRYTHSTGVTGTSGASEGTYGPHSSRIANALDPRVDSDRDNRAAFGTTGTSGTYGTTGSGLTGNTSGAPEGTYGPHGSRIANALDPRVDSDRDHRAAGYGGTTGTSGTTGTYGTTGSGLTGNASGAPEGTHGPHGSHIANALDPRVDSDRDHRAAGTTSGTTAGTYTAGVGAVGDPNDRSTGPAPHTAGPHKSDILNKLDPRVDSDLDGSRTIGGNRTHAGSV
jgi:hypothetical protein